MKKSVLFAFLWSIWPGLQANAQAPKSSVHYYTGRSEMRSMRGKQVRRGPGLIAVQRIFKPAAGVIEEIVQHYGYRSYTLFRRVGESRLFVVTDTKQSFLGTVEFSGGTPWNWTQWSYRIVLSRQTLVLIGDGKLTPTGISTQKYLVSKNGFPIFSIRETLQSASRAAYYQLQRRLSKATRRIARKAPTAPAAPNAPAKTATPLPPAPSQTTEPTEERQTFPIQIIAMSYGKIGISKVQVRIDGKYVGKTDDFGVWKGTITGKIGQKMTVHLQGQGEDNFRQMVVVLRPQRSIHGRISRRIKLETYLQPNTR